MARGLSREQSKEKNLKKQQGKNMGNTEGLTPAQRAERYASDSPIRDYPATPRRPPPGVLPFFSLSRARAGIVSSPRDLHHLAATRSPRGCPASHRVTRARFLLVLHIPASPRADPRSSSRPPPRSDKAAMLAKKAAKDAKNADLAASGAEGAAAVAEAEKRKAAQRQAAKDRKLDNFNPQLAKQAAKAKK